MRKEINPSYIKICKILKIDEHKDKHIVNCVLNCEDECSNRLMIWRNHNKAKCLGNEYKELNIGELDMIMTAEFDCSHRETEELMQPNF